MYTYLPWAYKCHINQVVKCACVMEYIWVCNVKHFLPYGFNLASIIMFMMVRLDMAY